MNVSDRIRDTVKDTFTNAKQQIGVVEKRVEEFEKKAKEQLDEVPAQLKGAWSTVVTRVRGALDFASREDLKKVAGRVDELAKKVERVLRGEKIRDAAKDTKGNSKQA